VADLPGHRTAIVLHQYPLCILAVREVLTDLEVEVAGTTTDSGEAVSLLERSRPDIFVAGVDGAMAPSEQVDYIRTAQERWPELQVIALSVDGAPEHVDAALKAGAAAYVVETEADRDELEAAVRQAVEWLDVDVERPAEHALRGRPPGDRG
jgi:DNA-binding NarL/FixJ family response regulator